MPKVSERPKKLQPYVAHGIDLTEGGKDATGNCPFCSREGKFNVVTETGQFRCVVCEESGNAFTFLNKIHELGQQTTGFADHERLATERKILYWQTLKVWGVVKSPITGRWLVPGYNVDAKLVQLYIYTKTAKGQNLLLATSGLSHGLFGMNLWNEKAPEVILCEGPWDGMALWEVLSRCSMDDKLRVSSKPDLVNVIATPGTGVFNPKWTGLGKNRVVSVCFDNDHPKVHAVTKRKIPPAGLTGMKKLAKLFSGSDTPSEELYYLKWGVEGYNLDLPHGYDVRDALQTGRLRGLAGRIEASDALIGNLVPVPKEWLDEAPRASQSRGLGVTPCEKYTDLQNAWRAALKWTPGLDYALSVMLASITSTECVGDQLWIKVIGPAACGKSTLCEALSTARDYVYPKDTFTGLSSGYQTDQSGKENLSLVNQIRDKTLIINDGDTMINLPNLSQVLSQLRTFYGRNLRTSFKNKMSANHEGFNATIILSGTNSLRVIDQSELGERFLDCVIMDSIDSDLEDEILRRVINRADHSLNLRSDGRPEARQEPEMTRAMQLTGGYVTYLRENAFELLAETTFSDRAKRRCGRLAKFTALMRARPSQQQEESNEREVAFRLGSQLTRAAKCLAVVLNKREVESTLVMSRVRQVALDTSRGRTLELVRHLYNEEEGANSLATLTNQPFKEVQKLLRFLRQIEALRNFRTKNKGVCWKLSDLMRNLYEEVVVDDES